MYENDLTEKLKKYALNSDNYKNWRKEHTKVFNETFENAFSGNDDAQICLTAALINISQRNFEDAIPKLTYLKDICENLFDETSVSYFMGLNHEMLGNEQEMFECYEYVRSSSITLKFTIPFHPYYRTAKFAQRASECSKAMHYYRKALEFYDGAKITKHVSSVVSHIIYEIATLCLYMHDYEECRRYLAFSYQYDDSENQQRNYVNALLCALSDEKEECSKIINTLNPLFKGSCLETANKIFNKTEPHYFAVSQDRSSYKIFWDDFLKDEKAFRKMLSENETQKVQNVISEKLTHTLSFMNRSLDCMINENKGRFIIKLKNYRVKTLENELQALFEMKPAELSDWEFISVKEFENYWR